MIKNKYNQSYFVSIFFFVYLVFAVIGSSVSLAQPTSSKSVPLYFGENRGSRGENMPMQENYKRILTYVENDLHIQFQFRFFPWNRAVKMASNEGGLIFGLSSTPERDKIFNFSVPATYNNIWLVTRSDKAFDFHTMDDLKGKTIGIVRGSKYGGEFDAKRGKVFKTDDDLDSYDIRLRKLLENRIDAMLFASQFDDPEEVEKVVNKISLSGVNSNGKIRFKVLSVPILKNDIRFAILKGTNDELIEKISHSLVKMQSISSGSSNLRSNKSKKRQ